MKLSLFFFCSLLAKICLAQQPIPATYEGTMWATSNRDSAFFKADTVQMIKIYDKDNIVMHDSLNTVSFFEIQNFIEIRFSNKQNLNFASIMVKDWVAKTVQGKYSWNYDKKTNSLTLCFKNRVFAKFTPLFQNEVTVPSRYYKPAYFKTTMLYLKRVKT